MEKQLIFIDNKYEINLNDFEAITRKGFKIKLSGNENYISLINKGNEVIQRTLKEQIPIYGVNTGFGDSCRNQVSYQYAKKLQENLVLFHGCGIGKSFSPSESLGMILLRLISNAKGYSGVTYNLLSQLEQFVNLEILPVIPELGSVGASGDLTPLSYIAAALSGKRKVYYKGEIIESKKALETENIKPLVFEPKEALAILNGTSVMTALSAFALIDAKKIIQLTELTTALTTEALMGNKGCFCSLVHRVKPHPGQIRTAETISGYLATSQMAHSQDEVTIAVKDPDLHEKKNILLDRTIQDKYSIRCSPQIIGVVWDTVKWFEEWLNIEMNSANDNPLIDPETGVICKGGNFYGGHICQGMDSVRAGIANLADLVDKQIELLIDEKFNNGLPANLVSPNGEDHFIHHGFKAMQISVTALTVEINSKTQPISVLSRPTESMNQDKVSLGTISARHTRDVNSLMKYILSIQLLALCQAIDLRGLELFSDCAKEVYSEVRNVIPFVEKDREMDEDIETMLTLIQSDIFIQIISKYRK